MSEVELKGVTKRYRDGTDAVKGIDLKIADGELMVLVGPSGCGKTTTLRMVAGLEEISSGEMWIGGRLVNQVPPKERDIAMVFQSYALYPHMTVRENMSFALRLAKVKRVEIEQRVRQAAETLDLTEHLNRKPANLSGGQRQRVALGRSIVRQPEAFLMDEPLSNLDAELRTQMRVEIARLQRRLGTTTVYVTHDQIEAMTLGDRVAVMQDGLIQQVDTPQRLYEDPRNVFVAGFIGSPRMNFVPARTDGQSIDLPFGRTELPTELRAELDSGAREILVGIRPEHIHDGNVADARPTDLRFQGRIEVVEWMGADAYVYLELPSTREDHGTPARDVAPAAATGSLVARVGASSGAAPGTSMSFSLDPAHFKLFEPSTGERLTGKRVASGVDSRLPRPSNGRVTEASETAPLSP